jgi:ABC-type multidrug transport system fused ATPase/permease subunit
MRKIFESKYWVLALSAVALLSLFLLAAEMKNADFRPGLQLSRQQNRETQELPIGQVIEQIASVPVWKKITFLASMVLMVVLFSLLLSPEWRRKLLYHFLRTMAIAIVIYLVIKNNPQLLSHLTLNIQPLNNAAQNAEAANVPVPEFQPPQVSNLTAYLIAFGIVLVLLIVFWLASRWWVQLVAVNESGHALKEIATAARQSLHQLSSGEDSSDAIIQCYVQMSHAVEKKRGLYRDRGMTAAEFAGRLEKAGLPRDPINRLTRLFEAVRYGTGSLSQRDIFEATECLNAILRSCGETA